MRCSAHSPPESAELAGRPRPEWLPLGPTTGGHDQLTQRFYEGFPDACFAVEDVIAPGDWVVIRYSLTATQAASPAMRLATPVEFLVDLFDVIVGARLEHAGALRPCQP